MIAGCQVQMYDLLKLFLTNGKENFVIHPFYGYTMIIFRCDHSQAYISWLWWQVLAIDRAGLFCVLNYAICLSSYEGPGSLYFQNCFFIGLINRS